MASKARIRVDVVGDPELLSCVGRVYLEIHLPLSSGLSGCELSRRSAAMASSMPLIANESCCVAFQSRPVFPLN